MPRKEKKLPVLLLKDYPGLGEQGRIVFVKPGFYKFLVSKKIVALATKQKLAGELKGKTLEEKLIQRKATQEEVKRRLEELILEIKLPRDPKTNKIFGSVNKEKIRKILQRFGFNLTKGQIDFPEKITEPGSYEFKVKLGYNLEATVKLKVL